MSLPKHLILVLIFLPGFLSGQSITITPESKTVGVGDTFTVDISMAGFTGQLVTAQGTLTWDPDVLYFDNTLNDALSNFAFPNMSVSQSFGQSDILFGKLYLLWTSGGFIGYVPPPVYFTIKFIVVGNNGSSSAIQIIDDNTPIEFSEFLPVPPFISTVSTVMNSGLITVGTGFPVTWLGLDAKVEDTGIGLTWQTALEINNDLFEVERLNELGEFEVIGQQPGAGTTDEVQTYFFLDQDAPKGKLAYRIKQIDIDGGTSHSSTVEMLNISEATVAYPNPAHGIVTLGLEASFQTGGVVVVRDLTGRILAEERYSEVSSIDLDLTELPRGWYSLETTNHEGLRTETRVLLVE